MLNDIAIDMEPINRADLISKIRESKIEVLLGRKAERIEPDGIILKNQNMVEEKVKTDVIVLAVGVIPANDLAKQIEGKIKEIYTVGDCSQARKIIDAVSEGFRTVMELT